MWLSLCVFRGFEASAQDNSHPICIWQGPVCTGRGVEFSVGLLPCLGCKAPLQATCLSVLLKAFAVSWSPPGLGLGAVILVELIFWSNEGQGVLWDPVEDLLGTRTQVQAPGVWWASV